MVDGRPAFTTRPHPVDETAPVVRTSLLLPLARPSGRVAPDDLLASLTPSADAVAVFFDRAPALGGQDVLVVQDGALPVAASDALAVVYVSQEKHGIMLTPIVPVPQRPALTDRLMTAAAGFVRRSYAAVCSEEELVAAGPRLERIAASIVPGAVARLDPSAVTCVSVSALEDLLSLLSTSHVLLLQTPYLVEVLA